MSYRQAALNFILNFAEGSVLMDIIKLKSGTFVPGLGLCSIPTYISRSNRDGAWCISYTKFPDAEEHYFADAYHGSVGNSLKAAIEALRKLQADEMSIGRALETKERPNKETLLDNVGISYYVTSVKGRDVHRFGVSDPLNGTVSTVYIGTDDTWASNYDKKLREAQDKRHGFERAYTIANYWRKLRIKPQPLAN